MKSYYIFLSFFIVLCSCNSSDEAEPTNNIELNQFTPDQADWSTFYSKPISDGVMSHDPDAFRKGSDDFSPEAWETYKWNGEAISPLGKTKQEFYDCLCPNPDVVRGIREVFYETQPFKDNNNPTKAEVDEWHKISINHIRKLVGYSEEQHKIKKDSCLFIRAFWGDQRQFTDVWDADYPDGICTDGGNIHCGAGFIPNSADQQAYLADGASLCNANGSEGVFVSSRSHIPWSLKWIRPFCNTIKNEGYWGGHVGPWFKAEKFGLNFWDNNVSNNKSFAPFRVKWGGGNTPEKYPENP